MTDGIIQKVIRKYRFTNCVLPSMILPCNCVNCSPFNELQQELIEEIKKLEKENNKDDLYNMIFTTDLIGDNE